MGSCKCCGKPLPSDSRKTRRFCDSGCRTRYTRGHRPPGPVAEVVDLAPSSEPVDTAAEVTLEEIASVLRATLHRSDTPASAKAGIAKELRSVMAEIARARPAAESIIDQLAARRAQRTGS